MFNLIHQVASIHNHGHYTVLLTADNEKNRVAINPKNCKISFLYRLQVNNSDSKVINNIVLYLAEQNHTAYP